MTTPSQLHRQIAALTALAEKDTRQLAAGLDDFAKMGAALNDVLPLLIETYGLAAATVAADWYDELREQHAIPRRFTATPPEVPPAGVPKLVDWARGTATTPQTMLELALGGMQKRIANASRETVMSSAFADPEAEGWLRFGNGDNCPFCNMLISRGAVYTEAGVRFGAHDKCNCGAAPSWGSPADIFDVDEYKRSRRRHRGDQKTDTAMADDKRARVWIAEHLP